MPCSSCFPTAASCGFWWPARFSNSIIRRIICGEALLKKRRSVSSITSRATLTIAPKSSPPAVYLVKQGDLQTPLQPHQQRVIDKLRASGGLLVAHGLGSGKTLSSIAAANALGLPIEAVVPAPLVANYEKEMQKHLGERPGDARVRSYEKAVREGTVNPNALVVMDEAHRARNLGTGASQIVGRQAARARARMLLTGTPAYNQPSDVASLLNIAAGRQILPSDPTMFKKFFVGEKVIKPGFWAGLRGAEAAKVPYLKNPEHLTRAATGYVDVHPGGGEDFPRRKDEEFHVPMSPEQLRIYRYHEGTMPWYLRMKIRAGLPMTKRESQELNAFQGALRQTSNTPRPYVAEMEDVHEDQHTPKLEMMARHLHEGLQKDPNFRGIAYSNYLEGGLLPISRKLTALGVPHSVFHGGVPTAERARMVREYNAGQTPVLLLSPSGTEGLDLKGTKMVQVGEPHWNDSRINQVIGRGIRYKSHEHLPESEREVKVNRYYSSLPTPLGARLGLSEPPQSIEQYIKGSADMKEQIFKQISEALQRASEAGPLKKRAALDPDSLTSRIQGLALHPHKPRTLSYEDPSGMHLELPYDPAHLAQRAAMSGLTPDQFVDQLQEQIQHAGLASLGDVDKLNKKLRGQSELRGSALGALPGILLGGIGGWHGGEFLGRKLTNEPFGLGGGPGMYAGLFAGGRLGASIGKRVSRALFKERLPQDVESQVQLPDLMPPREVSVRPKLHLKQP